MNIEEFIQDFQDYLVPKLDVYEQSIYFYIFRHGRFQGKTEIVIGFKSARIQMAFGIGEKGKPMSEASCYKRLRSLESKGCLQILGAERGGTRIKLLLPSEIDGLIPPEQILTALRLEEMDFFNVPENRRAILEREDNKCFYCLRLIDESNYIIEHVISRPKGDNSYTNLVASCVSCNNKKGATSADIFIRSLYRSGYLDDDDFQQRLVSLALLKSGDLKPEF